MYGKMGKEEGQMMNIDFGESFEGKILLYNILLLTNCYIGNRTTTCHSGSMSDIRDLTETLNQKISSFI